MNPRLAKYWARKNNAAEGGSKAENQKGEPTKNLSEEPNFPLVIFGGDIGGLRTANSSACEDFAQSGS